MCLLSSQAGKSYGIDLFHDVINRGWMLAQGISKHVVQTARIYYLRAKLLYMYKCNMSRGGHHSSNNVEVNNASQALTQMQKNG